MQLFNSNYTIVKLNLFVFCSLFLVLMLSSCQHETKFEPWEFKESGTNKWFPATVPGTVLTDLMANDLIPDPFIGVNEPAIKVHENKDWTYRTTFQPSADLMKNEKVEIIFEGLDTYADVYLNDSLIINANNMHRPWSAEIKALLKADKNELLVQFYSPVRLGQQKLEELNYLIPNGNESLPLGQQNSIFSRKAQYHFGWDWGPRLVSSGIWRQVYLKGWNKVKIDHVKIDVIDISPARAECLVNVFTSGHEQQNVKAIINMGGAEISAQKIFEEKNKLVYRLLVEEPRLWWPNGLGEAHLYDLNIELFADGQREDQQTTRVGIRTIELIQEPDSMGQSFYLAVNGQPVFMKGANYIPADFFNNRASKKYERVLQDAVDAHMNMLRVWGGAIYENDEFYKLCDEKGILIWQDFMSACAMIPTQKDYLKNFEEEAIAAVQRLHNHPSVAMWCGNNENLTGWFKWGWQQTYDLHDSDSLAVWQAYDTFFNHTLTDVVAQHGNGIYWPSSPSSGVNQLENKFSGDQHEWGIWFGQKPFQYFKDNAGRFISEYGLQSFPEMQSIRRFDPSVKDWDLETPALNFRQRSKMNWIEPGFDGFDMMRYYLEMYLPAPENLEDFVYLTQVNQALGLQTAIEAHRSNKPYTMGSLYWQIDDVWPTISWSTVDYFGRWKAAHYAVREANKPVVIIPQQAAEQLTIHVVTDLAEDFDGELLLELKTLDGTLVEEWKEDIWVAGLGNKKVKQYVVNEMTKGQNVKDLFLKMTLKNGAEVVDEGVHYFVPPKELNLSSPQISREVSGNQIVLKADQLVKSVALRMERSDGRFSDNYFDLLPGEEKVVTYDGNDTAVDLKSELKWRALEL